MIARFDCHGLPYQSCVHFIHGNLLDLFMSEISPCFVPFARLSQTGLSAKRAMPESVKRWITGHYESET